MSPCSEYNVRIPAHLYMSPHRRIERTPAFVSFIRVELDSAITYCRLAEQSECINPARVPVHLKNARGALDRVTRFMLRATLQGKEFDEITANAERLKFRLEALEARLTTALDGTSRYRVI